ncbi:MAG: tetratricopeptide repeat protein [Pirellulaceae bacterium]
MKHGIFILATTIALTTVLPRLALADAQDDLKSGAAALSAGELDKAITLLTAAAQGLPQSVDAHLALAECQLKLGQVDEALASYRSVLRLSPDHALAGRVVAALTTQQSSFQQEMSAARELMSVEAYAAVRGLLNSLLKRPLDAAQREQAQLLVAEALLWPGDSAAALPLVTQVAQQSGDAERKGVAQVLIALSLANKYPGQDDAQQTKAINAALAAAGEMKAPWSERAALVRLLLGLDDESKAAQVAAQAGAALASVPGGGLRQTFTARIESRLLEIARRHIQGGRIEEALAIAWPLVSGKPVPADDQVLKAGDARGGWSTNRSEVSRVLAEAGRMEFEQARSSAALRGLWLAGQVLLQSDDLPPADIAAELHGLAASLPAVSGRPADRKTGQPLSRGDEIQRAFILRLLEIAPSEALRQQAVALLDAQVKRYEAVGDLETGLAQYFTFDAEADPPTIKPIAPLDTLPAGSADWQVLFIAATRYASLGEHEFLKNAATQAKDANSSLNKIDAAVLALCSNIVSRYPGDEESTTVARGVFDRYLNTHQWAAVHRGAEIYYGPLPGDARRWSLVELKLRQVRDEEDRRLEVDRALPAKLAALLQEALKEITALVDRDVAGDIDSQGSNRARAIRMLDPITARYASLERIELAEAVIAAVAGEAGSAKLADWGLWARAQLLAGKASRALAIRAAALSEDQTLALEDDHKSELALLAELLDKHPQSPYVAQAVEEVLTIANRYEAYHSFDTARLVLATFLEAQPNLSAGERIEYFSVTLALTKARQAFDKREDADKPPQALSPEFAAALDALAAFLKAHPTGTYASRAESNLLGVMNVYGAAGGWSVSRDVLARFAAAVPDYRQPLRLKFMEAATYLGELDRQYGLSLLAPEQGESAAERPGDSDVASLDRWRAYPMPADRPTGEGEPVVSSVAPVAPGVPSQPFGDLPPAQDPATYAANQPAERPDATALAMIEQSQRRQMQQIAMYEGRNGGGGFGPAQGQQAGGQQLEANIAQSITLPTGPVLTEAEMKRQDEVSDKAYELLLALAKSPTAADAGIAAQARSQILWLFGFFEGQLRADRTIALIERYLIDNPTDRARMALAYRAINDRIEWAAQPRGVERVTLAWLNERHELFEQARTKIDEFIAAHPKQTTWINQARMLRVNSYDRQSQLAAQLSSVRAGGLLVQSVEALLELLHDAPDHPQASGFSNQLWSVAQRLRSLGEQQAAIYVLSQIPIHFPVDGLASQAVQTIAEIHAANLSNPLKAVETYQEYLYLNGDNEQVRAQIFSIAQQLASRQRYLEALHVYGVFVDSFPADPRAAAALKAIGEVHQANEVWEEAITTYERVLDEYPGCAETPLVRLAIAECQINLSKWRDARRIYEAYLQQYPQDGQVAMAQSRIQVLKNLDRYQTLLNDKTIERNRDDAQYQIGRIVREQLGNNVKAIEEFRKVVVDYPKSDLADDAQLEIGRSLLALGREEQARGALLEVPSKFPNSPVADDALYLVGQSYEQQAHRLASVSAATVLAQEFERNQRGAYQVFNENLAEQKRLSTARRDELKSQGKAVQLDLEEAAGAFRYNASNFDIIANTTRQAEQKAASETALQVANRQDRINEALREAVAAYSRATGDYPLGDMTDESLLRIAQIYETELKDRDAAMKTYQRVVELFPGTPVAEDAAWKLASFYEQQGKYTLAAEAYRDFIRKHPASGRVADAQFALAEVYEQLGKWVEAMDAYEVFRQKFAGHPNAQLAAEQINWIKAYRK